jgi:hypothetical protein
LRIFFQRSGGFAGLHSTIEFDTQSLPPKEQQEIQEYIDNSRFFDLSASSSINPRKGAADYYRYKISIEKQDRKHSIEINEFDIPPQLESLIDYLTKKVEK